MRRREFIALLGGAVAAWPIAAEAQPGSKRRIGFLIFYPDTDAEGQKRIAVFRRELQKLGWEDGRNVQIDYRWYGGEVERARTQAAELVALTPDVIISSGAAGLTSLQHATRTIPIVFVLIGEPVARGFVQSLAHPGRNITGFTNLEATAAGKWVQLIKEIAPDLKRVAIMFNPTTQVAGEAFLRAAEAAARDAALELVRAFIHSSAEIETALAGLASQSDSGFIILPDGFTQTYHKTVIALAARHRLAAVYPSRFYAEDGGLLSYGVDQTLPFQQAAAYADRILRGAAIPDLPVQQPTKFEMVINLKTAKALGLAVPQRLLVAADEVIE